MENGSGLKGLRFRIQTVKVANPEGLKKRVAVCFKEISK
jgi:hypothetical protein